ncbi:MAG: hypothetical protein GY774_35625 [Planctomycetes bacterium]|nr:hypothetical protein [Planctomycetota bacterium]
MGTFRVVKNKNHPFVMVSKDIIHDARLSWKAKAILIYFLSRPDNWQIYEKEILQHSTDGISATRSAIQELIKQGYIHRRQLRTNGKFGAYEYIVLESPLKSIDHTEIRFSDFGKPNTTNIDSNNTEGLLPLGAEGLSENYKKSLETLMHNIIDITKVKTLTDFDLDNAAGHKTHKLIHKND